MRRNLARIFLAFALALTPLGAMVHALSHDGADSDAKHFPGDSSQACPVCQAFSAAGTVAPPSAPLNGLPDTDHVLWHGESWSAVTLDSFYAYPRGPPRHPDRR